MVGTRQWQAQLTTEYTLRPPLRRLPPRPHHCQTLPLSHFGPISAPTHIFTGNPCSSLWARTGGWVLRAGVTAAALLAAAVLASHCITRRQLRLASGLEEVWSDASSQQAFASTAVQPLCCQASGLTPHTTHLTLGHYEFSFVSP